MGGGGALGWEEEGSWLPHSLVPTPLTCDLYVDTSRMWIPCTEKVGLH